MSVYKVIDIVGTRDLRIAEVTKLDVTLDDKGQVSQYRTKLAVSFKFEGT